MRVAVLSRSNRVVGGVEEYLRRFLAAAADSGNEVGFWYETTDGPPDRATIPDPPAGGWSMAELGRAPAWRPCVEWQPDVIYAHGLESPELEEEAYGIAPAVFFAHVYVGTCISGAKTTWFPVAKPCDRRFGPACLAHYFPRRCGGLNPLTMLQQYRLQSQRLAVIRSARPWSPTRSTCATSTSGTGSRPIACSAFRSTSLSLAPEELPARPLASCPTLLFLGRMEAAKGGNVLLDALPRVRAASTARSGSCSPGTGGSGRGGKRGPHPSRPVILDCGSNSRVGSRPAAGPPCSRSRTCWWSPASGRNLLARSARKPGLYGVPVAAFAVGGTPSWLTDGVNGLLAAGDPPTAAGLAEAIVGCLADPAAHQRLRIGALRLAGRFTWANHYSRLMAVLTQVLRSRPKQCTDDHNVASWHQPMK